MTADTWNIAFLTEAKSTTIVQQLRTDAYASVGNQLNAVRWTYLPLSRWAFKSQIRSFFINIATTNPQEEHLFADIVN